MRFKIIFVLALFCFMSAGLVSAQKGLDNVRLFQSYYRDAPITNYTFIDGGLTYNSFDPSSILNIEARGGYAVNPKLDITAGLGFLSYNYGVKGVDNQSGLSDLIAVVKYNLVPEKTKISVGGFVTAPIGKEEVGQGNLNFGAFGALRHPLSNGMVITANAGLDFYETTTITGGTYNWQTGEIEGAKEETDYESAFIIGGGAIYPLNEVTNIIGELVLRTKYDYMMLSGGVDYLLNMGGHLRGALGIGLDDGAPDLSLMVDFLYPLN